VWSAPSGGVLLSSNQPRYIAPSDQQVLMDTVCGCSTVCTAAFMRQATGLHDVQSTDRYATHTDIGCSVMQMSTAGVDSRPLSMDPSFDAVSLRNQHSGAQSRQDYISSFSPASATAPAVYGAVGVDGVSHLPAHGWGTTVLPRSSRPRYHHLSASSWQQADSEHPATTRSTCPVAAPLTAPFSPLQMSVTSVSSSTLSSASSPASNPYSPSACKTYSDASESDSSPVPPPLHMQPHYLENLVQLHCLLLASNKLLAPRYLPSVGAQRFDAYMPGNASRPTMFNVNRSPFSPGNVQQGFTAARFPRCSLLSDLSWFRVRHAISTGY